MSLPPPKHTALFDEHVRLGGRMVDFDGWSLPVQYAGGGVLAEHLAVRNSVGLFDVSHMGEVTIDGRDSESFLNYLLTNQVGKVGVGQAQYSAMCQDDGGIVDDLVYYRRSPTRFLVVVNASNTDKDFAWMQSIAKREHTRFPDLTITNDSAAYSQIAIQGRNSAAVLAQLTSAPLATLKNYSFLEATLLGSIPAILARTGYTGEDGFELYLPWDAAPAVWRALLEHGSGFEIKPCGLGARDTLRLEMKYALYGHELSENTHPLEAGLGWVTKLDKPDFVGKAALVAKKAAGITRTLVGIRLTGRGIPRADYALFDSTGSRQIGAFTSGTQSPSLGLPIGIGYVSTEYSTVGTQLTVDIRGQKIPAEIVPTPFYKRPY